MTHTDVFEKPRLFKIGGYTVVLSNNQVKELQEKATSEDTKEFVERLLKCEVDNNAR